MGLIRRRPLAKLDVVELYRTIARENPNAARAYLLGLEETLKTLSDHPDIGHARFKTYPELRVFVFRNHLIIYQPLYNPVGVDIVRILHSARDWMSIIDPIA